MSRADSYRTTVAVLEEIPLYLIPKVVQMQLKEAGGGVYEIDIKRSHYYHFTVRVVRLVKWHREDVLRNKAVFVVPEEELEEPADAARQEAAHV